MKRKIILFLSSLVIISSAAYFYFDTVFLPVQFKHFITTKATELLDRQVSIGAIDFKLFKGLIFEHITIARKDDPREPFVVAQKVTFNLLLAPFFQKKALIIPNIKIEKPFVYVARDKNGAWNFSDLLDLKKSSRRNDPPPILLRKLNLENGTVQFTDQTQKEIFHESVENIRINTTLSLNKGIHFFAEAHNPKLKSVVRVKGNHNIITRNLTAQMKVNNIHLARYLKLIDPSHPYVRVDNGIISAADLGVAYKDRELQVQGAFDALDANILVGQDKQMSGSIHVDGMLFTWSGQEWNAKGRMQLPDVHMTLGSGKEFQGNVTADLNSLTISGISIASKGNVSINNAYLKIDDGQYLKGNITAAGASLSKIEDAIELKGNVDVLQMLISFKDQTTLKGDLSTTKAQLNWSSPDDKGNRKLGVSGDLQLNSALLTLGPDQFISGTMRAPKTSLVYNLNKVIVESQGQVNEANIQLGSSPKFTGSPHFNISVKYDFNRPDPIDYKGTLHFAKSHFSGVPRIEEVNDIEGTVVVMPGKIQSNELTFNTQGTNIRLSGLLTDFRKPNLNIEASSKEVELKNIFILFPSLAEKIKGNIIGKAEIKASYKGAALSPSTAKIESTAHVAGVTVMLDGLDDDITNVSGRLEYRSDHLGWNDLLANYKNRSYTFDGQLNNFLRPVIDTKVTAEQLSLTAQIKILNQAFQLTVFAGDYLNSHFNVKGDIHLFKDADPDVDLRGNVALELRDLRTLVPRLKNIVDPLDPVGVLRGEGLYKGKLKDWRNWQLVINAGSDKITIKDYPFENVSVHFAQRDNTINKYDVVSTVYGGTLNIISSSDLRGSDVPFTAAITLKDLDLRQLREGQKPKNQKLAGILNFSSDLKGEGKKWRELTGIGSFTISGGHIWQWNILDGISGILLIPEFKSMAFTDAKGNFTVRDQKVHTENTKLIGNSATLSGKGWIDFDKNLNFDITPAFSELTILQSNSIKKKSTSIFTQTDGYINIKLTGTLDDPHYSVRKFPLKIIEDTIGGTTGTLKEVIGSIVDEIF